MEYYTHNRRAISTLLALAIANFVSLAAYGEPASSPPEMLADAELADIFFLDADRGWAAGDRGVILWTTDGGRRWQLADSPVNCRIEALFFLNDQLGWAVGGWIHPYTHKSSAVVLRTENGGRRWSRQSTPTLPKLHQVCFSDTKNGWAVGNASPMYPAGIFRSRDGGRSWESAPSERWSSWTDASRDLPSNPIAVGKHRIASFDSSGISQWHSVPDLRRREPRAAAIGDEQTAWVVGDGGLVLTRNSGSRTWVEPTLLPRSTIGVCDFQTVATAGPSVWIAGSPGSCVLHSPDGGETWQVHHTGGGAEIQAASFIDERRGWIAGTLGSIATTRDGGENWIWQRGRKRLAMLGLLSRPHSIPLELFARLAGDEGYLCAAEVLTAQPIPVATLPEATAAELMQEALVGVGAVAGRIHGQLPDPQSAEGLSAEQTVRIWDKLQNGGSLEHLEAQVIRRIRQWKPEVIITQTPGSRDETPVDFLVNQIVLNASRKAADPTSYPEQIRQLGLPTWQVKKVFAVLPEGGARGTIALETARVATRLGKTLSDYASTSRGLTHTSWVPAPSSQGFDLLLSELPRDIASRDFFRGIELAPGKEGRRRLGAPAATDLKSLVDAARKGRNVRQLLRHTMKDPPGDGGASRWLGEVDDLLADLSPAASGEVLFQLAQSYRAELQLDLAAETLLLLVKRYPHHALSEFSLLWLVQFQTSAEARQGLLRGSESVENRPWTEPSLVSISEVRPASLATPNLGRASHATHTRTVNRDPSRPILPNPRSESKRQTLAMRGLPAATLSDRGPAPSDILRRNYPTLLADPTVRCCLAALQRKSHPKSQPHLYLTQLAGTPAMGVWSRCARGEKWLSEQIGMSPKPMTQCSTTDDRPHLDGVLNEQLWVEAEILPLTSIDGDDARWKASVQFARDNEYLYWGAACRKVPGVRYTKDATVRTRDADLRGRDRLELLIDTDRDYATYFRLTIDYRGWTSEECFGEKRWDPSWFVAAKSDDGTWTIEAAIPLSELTAENPAKNEAWAIGVQRTAPGAGFQSWNHPANPDAMPQGFGYLKF